MNFLLSKVNCSRLTSRTSIADGALLLLCYTYEILQKHFSSKFDKRAFYQLNADSCDVKLTSQELFYRFGLGSEKMEWRFKWLEASSWWEVLPFNEEIFEPVPNTILDSLHKKRKKRLKRGALINVLINNVLILFVRMV